VTTLDDVLERARTLGVLGPGPVSDHVVHSEVFLEALRGRDGSVVDLGSGAGVPGLIIACARPDLTVTLIDSRMRRAALLEEAVEALALGDRVRVLGGRAEDLGRDPELRGQFDVATARSFGSPPVVAECGAPFLRVGGHLIVSEPPQTSPRWPADGLALVGLRPVPWEDRAVAVMEQVELCPEGFPRRNGLPAKRPLFGPPPG